MAVRVSPDKLTTLLDKLKTLFPISLPIHGAIRAINQCATDDSEIWVDAWPDVQAILVYPSTGKPGVPVLDHERKLFATNVESGRNLLENMQPLDGQSRVDLAGVRELLWPLAVEFAKSVNYHTDTEFLAKHLYHPHETELPNSLSVPDGFTAGTLQPSQAAVVNDVWEYSPGFDTEVYMKGLIQQFPSVAVYEQLTGDLVAWVMCYEGGNMGNLYVYPAYRRRGLATFVVISLMKILRERSEVPFVYIDAKNIASIALHTKVGFVPVEERIQWITCIKNA